jgi:hypothetical protein
MDFIDPHIRRINKIKLLVGYVLIGCAVIMTTLVLLYQAKGYGFGKNGQIIQNGLVYISSSPSPATIYLNGIKNNAQTNARLGLPAGEYTVQLTRTGYRSWQRAVGVEGGSVERFNYPFLFPQKLITTTVQTYAEQPNLVIQSPNRRWLLIQQLGSDTTFDMFDLSTPKLLKSTPETIPASLLPASPSTSPAAWQMISWSTDNIHVLLDRIGDGSNDYILFDTQAPDQSVDLTKALNLNNATAPAFDNNSYNQYYLFDQASGTLTTATLANPQPVPVLEHVLAYKTYGNSNVLYVTDYQATAGSVLVRWLQGSNTYTLRQLQSGATNYLLDLTQYGGNWYVVAGDSSGDKTYVYENPINVLNSQPVQPLVPVDILKVDQPNFEAFSASAQFVMAENGTSFSVYDVQNEKSYTYQVSTPITTGLHALWMDGDRLDYVSNSHIVVFDYDDANQQTLQPAIDGAQDFFDQNYKWSYCLTTTADPTTPFALAQTSLLIPADQ